MSINKKNSKKKLEPRLEEAQAGRREVFFIDAAHFVFNPLLEFLWSFTRLFLPAESGRKRFKVLGALNAIPHELISVTNETYINAQSVCAVVVPGPVGPGQTGHPSLG